MAEGYDPELPVLQCAGLHIGFELLPVVEVTPGHGDPGTRELVLTPTAQRQEHWSVWAHLSGYAHSSFQWRLRILLIWAVREPAGSEPVCP